MNSSLETISDIHIAYKKSGMWSIIKSAYMAKSKWAIVLWVSSSTVFIATIIFKLVSHPLVSLIILFIGFCFMVYAFNKSLNFNFSDYYKQYKKSIELHSKNRLFLRYLIFKENLQNLKVNQDHLFSIKSNLESEPFQDNLSVIMRHPITVVCITFLVAIVGGASSLEWAWKSGTMVYLSIFFVITAIINSITVDVLRSQSVKNKELLQFINWLLTEKSANQTLNSDG